MRQQPAMGAGRLAVRCQGSTVTGHVKHPGSNEHAGPLDGPAHLALSSRDAPLRDLRRGRRQRLRPGDRRQGPHLLRPQRRRHARLPLRPGRLLAKGLQQARAAVEPLRLRLLPGHEAPQRRRASRQTFVVYEERRCRRATAASCSRVAPLQGHVVLQRGAADRSSFQTSDVGLPITTTDPWFRPVDVKVGPDGAVYVADFYEGADRPSAPPRGQDRPQQRPRLSSPVAGCRPAQAVRLRARSPRRSWWPCSRHRTSGTAGRPCDCSATARTARPSRCCERC